MYPLNYPALLTGIQLQSSREFCQLLLRLFPNVPDIKLKQKQKKMYLNFFPKSWGRTFLDNFASNWVWKKPDLPPFWNKVLTGQTLLISFAAVLILFPVVYLTADVSVSQKDDNFHANIGLHFDWSFWHHGLQSIIIIESLNNGLVAGILFFLLLLPRASHSSHTSCKMLHSPRLARKMPVMQANIR